MSNSFFDFNTALPSLGSGKAHDYDQELLDAPEDIDQLNDETFGDAAIEEDWEEQHERLAEEIGSCRRGDDFSGDDFFSSGQKEELETSLTHLVDDEEPEPHYQQNGKPIPGRPTGPADVDSLFGPSSPPGLLNTEELIGGHQNIWGSPARESYMPRQEDGLKTLLKVLQSPKPIPVSLPQHQDPSIVTSGRSMPHNSLPNARTLEEIEHGMIVKKNGIPIRNTAPTHTTDQSVYADQPRQPLVRTLEDIEQELTGHANHKTQPRKVPSPPQPGFPFPIGTPPQASGFMSQSGPVPIPGGILTLGHSVVPPPMPTPGQLSKGPGSLPSGSQSAHQMGSSPQITILQRNTPPPSQGVQNPSPGNVVQTGPQQQPQRTSPVFMVNQGRRRVYSTPSPSELSAGLLYGRQQAPSPTQLPSQTLARLKSMSPDLYKANLTCLASSPITHGILSGMIGNQGDMAGSPAGPRSIGPPRMPGDRPVSPLEGTPFMPNTPQHTRMQSYSTHSDSSHHRGHRGGYANQGQGHFQNQSPGGKQGMFAGHNKNGAYEHPLHGRDNDHNRHPDSHSRYPDNHNRYPDGNNRHPDGHNRHTDTHYRGPRDDYGGLSRGGRGDYNHRGDYGYRGSGEYNHRGGRDYRGDFSRRGGRGDYNYSTQRGRGDDFHHWGGYNRGGLPPRDIHHGYQHRPRYNSYGEDDYDDEPFIAANKDEFAGLMTKKEKDWVIKIQLMQLQTENPYLDDYYYTRWAMKRMVEERQLAQDEKMTEDKSEPKLVIPHLARVEAKGYKPVQFENSLGRVTASSVHNPRQIIDIKRTSSLDHEDARAREVRRYKELLLEIEQGYDLLLDIDDLEKKALGVPEESRPPLFEERHGKIHHLYHIIASRSNGLDGLYEILLIRKGIKLVCRLLPLLPTNERHLILSSLLQNLTAISKKDWQKEVLPYVYQSLLPVIQSADLEALVGFTEALLGGSVTLENGTNTILSALQNKFGSSVIWCLVSRGEKLYATQSPVDMELSHQESWSRFVSLVATTLRDLSKDQLAAPRQCFPSVPAHMEQLIDKRTYVSVEDKLAQLVVQDTTLS